MSIYYFVTYNCFKYLYSEILTQISDIRLDTTLEKKLRYLSKYVFQHVSYREATLVRMPVG